VNRYKVVIRWTHRKWGPQLEKAKAEGTSIRRALNNALLAFFSERSLRERRRDAHVALQLQIERLNNDTARR